MKKIILSLFDLTGNWSRPWKENGYEVIQIDLQLGTDILTWDYKQIEKNRVYGILAACPCTDFSNSGARWFKRKDLDGTTQKSIDLVSKTLEIVNYFKPKFWVIENPVGRIEKLNPGIGNVKYRFNPYDFAGYGFENDRYNKRTCLWGNFNNPIKKPLPPLPEIQYRIWKGIDKDGKQYGWNTIECKNARSETPMGFAYAFYEANKEDI